MYKKKQPTPKGSPTPAELRKWLRVNDVKPSQAARILGKTLRCVRGWMSDTEPPIMPIGYWVLLRAVVALSDQDSGKAAVILSEVMIDRSES